MLFAHVGHWLVNLIYAGPVILISVWIAINAIRDRRREPAGDHPRSSEPDS